MMQRLHRNMRGMEDTVSSRGEDHSRKPGAKLDQALVSSTSVLLRLEVAKIKLCAPNQTAQPRLPHGNHVHHTKIADERIIPANLRRRHGLLSFSFHFPRCRRAVIPLADHVAHRDPHQASSPLASAPKKVACKDSCILWTALRLRRAQIGAYGPLHSFSQTAMLACYRSDIACPPRTCCHAYH